MNELFHKHKPNMKCESIFHVRRSSTKTTNKILLKNEMLFNKIYPSKKTNELSGAFCTLNLNKRAQTGNTTS